MFKIKDLMIKVVPQDAGGERVCCTYTECVSICSQEWLTCHHCSDTCSTRTDIPCCANSGAHCTYPSIGAARGGSPNLETLAALKAELKLRLANVERQEQLLAESLMPATAEDIDALEKKLTDALGELRTMKSHLKKKKG